MVCTFSDCVGGNENKGNDFCDVSSVADVVSLYSSASLFGIQSYSQSIKFYFELLDLSLDCIIEGECGLLNDVYVLASGRDTPLCGSVENPCRTVDYVFSDRLDLNGTIYISGNAEYGVSCRGPADYQVAFEGIGIPSGAVMNSYPALYPANNGDIWLNTSNEVQKLSINNFRVIVPASGFIGYLFRTKDLHSETVITNCFIYYNGSAPLDFIMPRVIYGDSGVFTFTNVVVFNLSFNGVGFLRMDYPGTRCTYTFANSSFTSIVQKGSEPSVFNFGGTPGYYFVQNVSFTDITQGVRGGMGSVIDWPLNPTVVIGFSDLYFRNVTARQHVVRFNTVGTNSVVQNLQFYDCLSVQTVGAAIYVIGGSSTFGIMLTDCIFSSCNTSQDNGGFFLLYV
jgi:hypothetical protein